MALSRRNFLRSAVLVAGGTLLAACQPISTPPPYAEITPRSTVGRLTGYTIGAVVPLTGRYASLGEQVKNGYELAFADLNATSKIPLELKILDDESDPTKTVQRVESLLSNSEVLAQLGGAGSDLHAAGAVAAEKNRAPYLGVAFSLLGVHQKGLRYLFSPFPKSPAVSSSLFGLMDGLSPKPVRVAIFAERTEWGGELSGFWRHDAVSRGYEVVADEQYTPGAQDYSSLILKAKSASADALLTVPTPPDGMAMLKQMKELDFSPKLLYFIRASDGNVWTRNLGKDGDLVLNMPGWSPDLTYPGSARVRDAHQATYGKPAEGLVGAAYVVVQVLFDAINRVGRPDRDAVRDAIAATNMLTLSGPVSFNADGTSNMVTVVNQWVDGRQTLVLPAEQAPQPLRYPATPWRER
jgi:branched-chain amino acid transport system substrate-binding protein